MFSCEPLSAEQWMWCLLFGVGCLVWGQLITCIPVHSLPKSMTVGRDIKEEDIAQSAALSQVDGQANETKTKGQILWIRSISRLQQQVSPLALSRLSRVSAKPTLKHSNSSTHPYRHHTKT